MCDPAAVVSWCRWFSALCMYARLHLPRNDPHSRSSNQTWPALFSARSTISLFPRATPHTRAQALILVMRLCLKPPPTVCKRATCTMPQDKQSACTMPKTSSTFSSSPCSTPLPPPEMHARTPAASARTNVPGTGMSASVTVVEARATLLVMAKMVSVDAGWSVALSCKAEGEGEAEHV